MSYIETIGISKIFSSPSSDGNGQKTVALMDTSLSIDQGSLVSIVGPSGCGKSTLLQIIAGLVPASAGTVLLQGNIVDKPPYEMIYVFQQYTKSIFPWKTVRQNVAFGLKNRTNVDDTSLRTQCDEYISLVDLCGFEDHYPWQLSGGMQQRVAIARALICKPDVLLMDEPFSSVDAITRSGLQDLLLRIWKEFTLTVLFVTHDIDEAVYLSERVLVMCASPGRMVEDVVISLPFPRDQLTTREMPTYIEYRRHIHHCIFPGNNVTEKQKKAVKT